MEINDSTFNLHEWLDFQWSVNDIFAIWIYGGLNSMLVYGEWFYEIPMNDCSLNLLSYFDYKFDFAQFQVHTN